MSPDFWTTVQEAVENAPEAGYANVNFGRLIFTPMRVTWETVDGARHPTKEPFKDGDSIGERESLEFNVVVKISELNTQLDFDYERNVAVRKSGRVKTDWSEIVEPSLIAVFGKEWHKVFKAGKTIWVEVEDVPNVAGKASAQGKVYGVPKFLRRFKDRA
ncbi:MAG TPA: hypothetical protein VIY48_11115, partial [Candidatus Paceibacterota bacterium]